MDPYLAWILLREGWTADMVNKAIRLLRFQDQNPYAVFYGVGISDWLKDVQQLNTYEL